MNSENSRQSAITQQILKHRTAVYGFIMAHVRDVAQAEDIFQEVCVALCEQWDRYDRDRPFVAWALGIARNKIMQHYEGDKRFISLDPELSKRIAAHPGWTHDDTHEKQALRECMRRLSKRISAMVAMRYVDNLTAREIADKMGWKARSVSVALTRAKMKLMDCIDTRLRRTAQQNG